MKDWPVLLGLPLWFWLFVAPVVLAALLFFSRRGLSPVLPRAWAVLDRIYFVSGVLAAVCMVGILLIIVVQMIARWTGFTFEGSTEFAGYAMAATSFFALAHALGRGAHIRVSIFLNINNFTKLWLDGFALLVAAITATYFARFAVKTNFISEMLNDRTQGQDQIPEFFVTLLALPVTSPADWPELLSQNGGEWIYTPVWVPQIAMSIGTILLALCLWDHFIRLIVTGHSAIKKEKVE
ncbi:MAG: TRAP transporter small permease subunit [Hyphomicrobiales bacterium]|nr:TRAP transporter small permease subunit [Hyphomicrobiales bacterium]MCY4038548.1 TRAP transporter small permease subunit [Hyphomicrobiales bacterium]